MYVECKLCGKKIHQGFNSMVGYYDEYLCPNCFADAYEIGITSEPKLVIVACPFCNADVEVKRRAQSQCGCGAVIHNWFWDTHQYEFAHRKPERNGEV